MKRSFDVADMMSYTLIAIAVGTLTLGAFGVFK